MPIIESLAGGDIIPFAGAPAAGTDEVQTLTIGGTPTGGTFALSFDGHATAPITWVAVNATLLAAIQVALEALPNIGGGNILVAAGTLTAGIGTATLTFRLAMGKLAVNTIGVAANNMTGTAPTLAVAETTPGVNATLRGSATGAVLVDSTTGILYANTGTAAQPTWTKVGTQT
jgi:hypothetical protein